MLDCQKVLLDQTALLSVDNKRQVGSLLREVMLVFVLLDVASACFLPGAVVLALPGHDLLKLQKIASYSAW
jgi:hypothetical protein